MEYVQFEILKLEMLNVLRNPNKEPLFATQCNASYVSRNDPKKNSETYYGVLIANRFQSFLRQHCGFEKGSGIFFQFSLDLNALVCSADLKSDLTLRLGKQLGIVAPDEALPVSALREFDRRSISRLNELAAQLKGPLKGGAIRPEDLCKMLKRSHL